MIALRAIFWITVAVILVPRDPDLGFASKAAIAHASCETNSCIFSATSPGELRDGFLMRLHQVKADLAAKEALIASR